MRKLEKLAGDRARKPGSSMAAPSPTALSSASGRTGAVPPPGPRRTELILRQIDALPALPAIAARLLQLTSTDDAPMSEIVRLIESDPALAGRVLAICARANIGLGQPVTTIDRAVVMLGLRSVRAAVLSVQVMDWVSRIDGAERDGPDGAGASGDVLDADRGTAWDREGYWRHSVAVACCAELLCAALTRRRDGRGLHEVTGEAFAGGLLHDLGKLALAITLPRAYGRVAAVARETRGDIAKHEREIIGLDHLVAGKRLSQRWGLPAPLRDVIWLHGLTPGALPASLGDDWGEVRVKPETPRTLVGVVSLADALCRWLHIGWSGNHVRPALDQVCRELGVNPEVVEGVAGELHGAVARRCADLGLAQTPSAELMLDSIRAANAELTRAGGARVLARPEPEPAVDTSLATMREIAAFWAGVCAPGGELTLAGVLEHVARSAWRMLGASRLIAACEAPGCDDGRASWLVVRSDTDAGGSPVVPVLVEPPGQADAALELDRVVRALEPGAPRASPELLEALDVLGVTRSAGGPHDGWVGLDLGVDCASRAVLLYTSAGSGKEPSERLGDALSESDRRAVAAAWSAALLAARSRERSERLAEDLARVSATLARTQQELGEAQSLARLGRLTAGAAHEMNNPLAVISGRAQALAANPGDPQARAWARAVLDATGRLSTLIERLNLIADPPRPKLNVVGVPDLLGESIRAAKDRTAGRGPRDPLAPVWMFVADPVAPLWTDAGLARTALVEVIVNALEAGGKAPVRIEAAPLQGRGGPGLLLHVIDDGVGLSERARVHAFDPFFSEKPAGRQTGLGLPTARALLERLGGSIELVPDPDGGTRATIELPGVKPPGPDGPGASPGATA